VIDGSGGAQRSDAVNVVKSGESDEVWVSALVHFGFLLRAALLFAPINAPTSHTHCSTTRFSAKMLFATLTALHYVNRVEPLRTAAHHHFHQSQGALIRAPYG